jgi:insertion element IS1 protein InsB
MCGRRQDTVFVARKALWEPFGITRFFTDGWGTYARHVAAEQHTMGKAHTQTIERTHINWRTRIKRLVRRTILLCQDRAQARRVIGLFINRYEFGRLL